MNYFSIPGLFSSRKHLPKSEYMEMLQDERKKRLKSSKRRLKEICQHLDVSPELIKNRNRRRPIAVKRHIAAYILRKRYQYPLPIIGQVIDRDHSTAMHSINQIETFWMYDPNFREAYKWIFKEYNLFDVLPLIKN